MISIYRSSLLTVVFAAVLPLGCGSKEGGAPNASSSAKDGGKKTADLKPDFTISAVDLAKEFIADEKAANAKYTGKTVEVEGVVNTSNPLLVKPGVFLLEGAKKNDKDVLGLNLNCACPGQEDKVAMLSRGQKVKAKGNFIGGNGFGLTLGSCSYTELTLATNIVVTAKQLTEDYAKDERAADKKYRDKEVVVDGEVADLVEKNGFFSAKLAGAKPPLVVSCTIGKEEFSALKKGQQVTIKGDCSLFADNQVTVNTAFLVKKNR